MIQFPGHAPFSETEGQALSGVLTNLSAEQRLWLSGFLAGVAGQAPNEGQRESNNRPALVVLYGTESGNSEALAEQTAKLARQRGFEVRVRNMVDARVEELREAGNLLVIVSTWGEGDPPETAEGFYKAFMSGASKMEGVSFSVCALGDTSYEQFCEIGKQFDRRLEDLGAQRVAPRADCDVDFEAAYGAWVEKALEALDACAAPRSSAPVEVAPAAMAVPFGKKNPFPAAVSEKVLLNGQGSKKETWHLELKLEGSGLVYEPGDSLAVAPRNAEDVVEEVLQATGVSGDEEVETKTAGRKRLREALAADFDITALSRKVATAWQERAESKELAQLLEDGNKELFKDYVEGRQIVDLLADFPVRGLKGQELVGMLRALPPRLYSIASSPRAHPGEVHLTVAAVRYETHGRSRKGVASTCLADMVQPGDTVPVFVTPNKRFRLPENDNAPIVMVGPGTGIAPFRAFVEERAARGVKGPSWLFFGDQHYTYDFLYQLEWQDHLKSGALSRLDVAFSRDQPEKVYVQDRMRERAAELWSWLEDGAHFYVCGDASRMATDVHNALVELVARHGGRDPKDAEAYVEALKKSGKYQRDVY